MEEGSWEILAKNLVLKTTNLGIDIKKNSCLSYTFLMPKDNLVEWGMVYDVLAGVKYSKPVLIVFRENELKNFYGINTSSD